MIIVVGECPRRRKTMDVEYPKVLADLEHFKDEWPI
jgi:hypothetical protein